MDEEKLIRDFDILGIQKEVDLIFVISGEEISIPNAIIEREYNSCLKYNDFNKNKIIKAEITYGDRFETLGIGSGDSFVVNKIMLWFSNGSLLSLIYKKNTGSFIIIFANDQANKTPSSEAYFPDNEILKYLEKDAVRSIIDSYLFVLREISKDKNLEKILLENDIL